MYVFSNCLVTDRIKVSSYFVWTLNSFIPEAFDFLDPSTFFWIVLSYWLLFGILWYWLLSDSYILKPTHFLSKTLEFISWHFYYQERKDSSLCQSIGWSLTEKFNELTQMFWLWRPHHPWHTIGSLYHLILY